MSNIHQLIRKNIRTLTPYSSARDEFSDSNGIFLDANESPYGVLNRYPAPYQTVLKKKISKLKQIPTENIFLGNGSDEVIDIIFRIFAEPYQDEALIFTPTYGMYEVSANINAVRLHSIPLNKDFQIENSKEWSKQLNNRNLKIIFICSPNNPTGNLIERTAIEEILTTFKGIVVIDEAYIDFAKTESWITKIKKYNRLIVLQTFSKFWGMASVRVGMGFAHSDIISYMNKVKPPYNISLLNQKKVIEKIENQQIYQQQLKQTLKEKEKLQFELSKMKIVKKIYPSDANFILVEFANADAIYNQLIQSQIIVRNRHRIVENCLRITIGTPEENQKLITALKNRI